MLLFDLIGLVFRKLFEQSQPFILSTLVHMYTHMCREKHVWCYFISHSWQKLICLEIFWPPLKESFNRMNGSDDGDGDGDGNDSNSDNDRTDMGEI